MRHFWSSALGTVPSLPIPVVTAKAYLDGVTATGDPLTADKKAIFRVGISACLNEFFGCLFPLQTLLSQQTTHAQPGGKNGLLNFLF